MSTMPEKGGSPAALDTLRGHLAADHSTSPKDGDTPMVSRQTDDPWQTDLRKLRLGVEWGRIQVRALDNGIDGDQVRAALAIGIVDWIEGLDNPEPIITAMVAAVHESEVSETHGIDF